MQRGAAAGTPAGQRAATAWVSHTTRHAKMPMPDSETPPMRTAAGGPGVGGSLRNRPAHGEISSSGRCTGISGAWRASVPQSDSGSSVRTCGASAHAPASGTPPRCNLRPRVLRARRHGLESGAQCEGRMPSISYMALWVRLRCARIDGTCAHSSQGRATRRPCNLIRASGASKIWTDPA